MLQLLALVAGLAAAAAPAEVALPSEPAPRLADDGGGALDERTERRVRRQRRGGDAFREDVVTLHDGTVLRGTITSQEPDAWFIRVAGGSVLRIDPTTVDTHFRESRYAHPTAHGRQALLRVGAGFEGDIAYAENFGTHSGLATEIGLGWAPHNNVELDLAAYLGPSGTKLGLGLRYFVNAQSALKAYGGTTFLLAGPQDPKGLRLLTGFQLDSSRWLGFFFHHGATAFGQGSPTTIHLGYHMELGVQARY
jgi:hypothetical protein